MPGFRSPTKQQRPGTSPPAIFGSGAGAGRRSLGSCVGDDERGHPRQHQLVDDDVDPTTAVGVVVPTAPTDVVAPGATVDVVIPAPAEKVIVAETPGQ